MKDETMQCHHPRPPRGKTQKYVMEYKMSVQKRLRWIADQLDNPQQDLANLNEQA